MNSGALLGTLGALYTSEDGTRMYNMEILKIYRSATCPLERGCRIPAVGGQRDELGQC
jgi:hypothetical protein